MSRMTMPETETNGREIIGKYEVVRTFNDCPGAGVPVVILAAIDADNPMRYQVRRRSTTIQFGTLKEVLGYCRKNGWIK